MRPHIILTKHYLTKDNSDQYMILTDIPMHDIEIIIMELIVLYTKLFSKKIISSCSNLEGHPTTHFQKVVKSP